MTNDSIKDLRPDPQNARQHNPRNLAMIEDSLRRVGAARSVVIDDDNIILAGNGVVAAAEAAGIERIRVIETDGDEIIAVRRSGLTDEQKRLLAYYDNRTAELATWSAEQVVADLDAGLSLEGMFYEDELATILGNAADDLASVEFREYDESVADEVEYLTCPECGHRWPK